MPTEPSLAPAAIRQSLLLRREIAVLDVRMESRFALGHPLFAASFPLGQLESLVAERLPRPGVPIVVYGDGAYDGRDGTDPDAEAAARRLRQLGYRDVSLLAGGLGGWTAAGGELFRDVNAPSKAFGELVAERAGTPLLPAVQVAALLRATATASPGPGGDPDGSDPAGSAAPAVVVDARPFNEYATMSIPTATSVPGAELVLRVRELAPDPATAVIVNCAGRTRSIIGAQSLINAGLPNPVAALRNGTIGWTLAGLELERGQARRAPGVQSAAAGRAAADAWRVADLAGVRRADAAGLAAFLRALGEGEARTVYLFDVRTPDEYVVSHLPGFRSAPGGQLVQETDWYAPVRGALLVLADDGGGRAAMTGSWLAQMGWDVIVVASPADAPGDWHEVARRLARGPWRPSRPTAPAVRRIGSSVLARWLRDGEAVVVDLETSKRYLAGHIPGASWALRADLAGPALAARLGRPARLVLTSDDGYLAAWAAADLIGDATVPAEVFVLAGGTRGWEQSGRAAESGRGDLLSAAGDVYRRPYEGTGVDPAVMQAYLDWEYGLVAQLDRDGTHGFSVLVA
jgi:rhodanese-related sulfurtransferase